MTLSRHLATHLELKLHYQVFSLEPVLKLFHNFWEYMITAVKGKSEDFCTLAPNNME